VFRGKVVGRAEGGVGKSGISFHQMKGGRVKTTGVCVCGAELAGKAAFTAGRPRVYCSAYCRLRAWRLEAKERRGRRAKEGGELIETVQVHREASRPLVAAQTVL
jgi:hypothetical protein